MEKSAVKRASEGDSANVLAGIKAVVFELDGTVIPANFFLGTLVKYVSDNTGEYVKENYYKESVTKLIDALRDQAAKDVAAKKEGAAVIPECTAAEGEVDPAVVAAVAKYVKLQMDNCSCMNKTGEDMFAEVIAAAYNDGKIKGTVLDDAVLAMKKFTAAGLKVYLFADYCAETAQLTIKHSSAGDLSSLISGYHDYKLIDPSVETVVHMKHEATYKKLADTLKVKVPEILYITHKAAEVVAARKAGARAVLVIRSCLEPVHPEHGTEEDEKEVDLGDAMQIKCLTELWGESGSPTKKQKTGESGGTTVCVETGCGDSGKAAQ